MFKRRKSASAADVTRHYRIDEKQRVRQIIKNEIQHHGKSLDEIKDTVSIEIGKCRNSYHRLGHAASKEQAVVPFKLGSIFDRLNIIPPACYELCSSVYKRLKGNIPVIDKRETKLVKVSLSSLDHAYIEKKFVKYCLELWLEEAISFSNKIIGNPNEYIGMIQDILLSLGDVQDFYQIPEPFRALDYYKLLTENYGLIKRNDEKRFLIELKKHLMEQITANSSFMDKELNFFKVCMDFLLAFKNIEEISDQLELQSFCSGDLPFDQFLGNIKNFQVDVHVAEATALKEAAQCLNRVTNPFGMEKFKEILGAYLEEVRIELVLSDGRLVIEVIGKNIALSYILQKLEEGVQSDPNVEEVRIAGADILHIDADLKNTLWHGKNIVVFVKKMKIYDTVTWNVSGQNSDHTYKNDAGTGEDGHGKRGADGYNGESGGNVLIHADEIENQGNFTIISNGGKGSPGQDGGNGVDGKDGKGITKADFEEKFPSIVKFFPTWSELQKLINKTVTNLKSAAVAELDNWHADDHHFIDMKTREGNEVTFSFCTTTWSTRIQAFLLYKGSLGQPPGQGGEFGLGAQGGYKGEITTNWISEIVVEAHDGEHGENGKGGKYGKHGKNGWDIGYTDYQWWSKPQYYGTDQKHKLKLEYTDDRYQDQCSVWCPFKDQYATIKPINVDHQISRNYEERMTVRQDNQRQRQTQATKKKTISQSRISSNYAHYFSSIGRSMLDSLKSNLENINQLILQAMAEISEQQEKVAAQVNVKRVTTKPIHWGKEIRRNVTSEVICDSSSENITYQRSCARHESENLGVESEKGLLSHERPELIEKSHSTERLATVKYRYATFEKIANQLPVAYQRQVTVNLKLNAQMVEKYLVVDEQNYDISHPVFGTLDQYFSENSSTQRKNILKSLKKEFRRKRNPDEAFKRSISAFVLGAEKSEQMHSNIMKYYDEYKKYLDKQKQSLQIFLEPFLDEIQRYKHILALWIKSGNDKSVKYELMKEIKREKFLYALWKRVDNQLRVVYSWNQCYKDQDVFEEYKLQIQKQGSLSASYREFLAYVFNINIRLYVEDQDNQFHLFDEHNPSSKKAIHILQRDNEFIHLAIDENFLKLEMERERQDNLYMQIFAQTKSFKSEQEFDDYSQQNISSSSDNFVENVYSSDEALNIDMNIKNCFAPSQFQDGQMIECLEKLKPEYIGHKGILTNILDRFSNDGVRVSMNELACLVNSILASFIRDNKELNIYCWIVAAYPQDNWIDEVVLLCLENYFRRQLREKCQWREYLRKIVNKNILVALRSKLNLRISTLPVSIQCIGDILQILSDIPNDQLDLQLAELDVSEWLYILKEKYWTHKLKQSVDWVETEKLSKASYYLLSVENIFGTLLVEKLIDILKGKEDLSPDIITDILINFHGERWILGDDELVLLSACDIVDWMERMRQKFIITDEDRNITQLIELIKSNANTSEGILHRLPSIEIALKNMSQQVCQYPRGSADSITGSDNSEYLTDSGEQSDDQEYTDAVESTGTEVLIAGQDSKNYINKREDLRNAACREAYMTWHSIHKSEFNNGVRDIEQARTELLVLVDRAIEMNRGFKLRDTQKLAVLALLTNKRNTLAQISTGEGKSLIVVAAAIIMKALYGYKVDIITSSSVLAKRDSELNEDIYNLFDINVSNNCNEDIEKRKEAYSSSQIVYGDLANFQRDYLLDRFYGKNILGDRNFENIIVDEVDSMLLDKGNEMLYLSHDLPGLDKLEPIYIFIWQWVNKPVEKHEDILSAFNTQAIKLMILDGLYGIISKEDIKKIDPRLNELTVRIIWEHLIKAQILDNQGKILEENINENKFEAVLPHKLRMYEDQVCFLIRECLGRIRSIQVPNYLKPFIEQHLESWINSAIVAAVMRQGQDYIIDVDRTGTSPDLNPNVTILDRDTGTDQANSQWDEALHQFLQLKHGCKLSLQSLKAVFISNVSYLKLYNRLYGLTGTLGSKRERDLLKEVHNVDFVTIPTARSKQFIEEVPILCANKKEWMDEVFEEAIDFTNRRQRSVLIICETISDAETLSKYFMQRGTKVYTYTRDYREFDIAQGTKKLETSQIIIATNLAGRGTDIKITENLRETGGLHVCLTYLPNNSRIEQQAFGRAARSGDKGSGRLIIMSSIEQESENLKILDLKKQRDEEELHRISTIKAHYETKTITEEQCFKGFKDQYESLKKFLVDKSVHTEAQEVLLQSCLDRWAFWLDRNSRYIKNRTDEHSRKNFKKSLHDFTSLLNNLKNNNDQSFLSWVESQPMQMVKLGKYFCHNKKHDVAIKLFDKVIALEPNFCEAAHYYKAFSLVKTIEWENKPVNKNALLELKVELREAARLVTEHHNFSMSAIGIISSIKQHDKNSIIQISTYAAQQESRCDLYQVFLHSIDRILGQFPAVIVNEDISEELSEIVFHDLVRCGILKKPHLRKTIPKNVLKKISFEYGMPAGKLNDLLSTFGSNELDEKEFRKKLKKCIKLASREDFWKLLVQEKILTREVKYVIIDVERLTKVDPKLLEKLRHIIEHRELKDQFLEYDNINGILLHKVQVETENSIILEKNVFKDDIIGNIEVYKYLKKKGVFSINRRASLDLNTNPHTTFSRYDSMTLADFDKVNISRNDARQILWELIKQNVLKLENSDSGIYRLAIPSNEIEKIQLPQYPVYENAVKGLVSFCFIYRITLENIKQNLQARNFPIHPQLISDPYRQLICELNDKKIIKPFKIGLETHDIEKKLRYIYSETITRNDLSSMLSQYGLDLSEKFVNYLCQELVEKGWLTTEQHTPSTETVKPGPSFESGNSAGTNSYQFPKYLTDIEAPSRETKSKYTIAGSDKRKSFTSDKYFEDKIKLIFDHRLALAKDDTINHIVRCLNESRGLLKTLTVPDSILTPVVKYVTQSELKHIEEVTIFNLNGLGHVLQFEEKKWSKSMLRSTMVVIGLGVLQIVIGTILLAYVPVIDGELIIGHGVADIGYAIEALRHGHFSWTDYLRRKTMTLIITTLTITANLLKMVSSKASLFGSKINQSHSNSNLSNGQTNSQIPTNVGMRVAKEAGTSIAVKITVEGIKFGLSHAGCDAVIKHQLQTLCDRISNIILRTVGNNMDSCDCLFPILEETYLLLGKDRAIKLVNELNKKYFNQSSFVDNLLPILAPIGRSVVQEITQAIVNMSYANDHTDASPNQIIGDVLGQVSCAEDLVLTNKLKETICNYLNNCIDKLQGELIVYIQEKFCEQNALERKPDDYENFKKTVIDEWKSMLLHQTKQIIDQDVVCPIMGKGGDRIIRYYKNLIRRGYRSYSGGLDNERFAELRQQHHELHQTAPLSEPEDPTGGEHYAVNEYHKNMYKVMDKTRNHKLFASMVRENISMNVNCLDLVIPVIRKMLGISTLTVILKRRGRVCERLSFSGKGVEENYIIELETINNYFKLHGNGIVKHNQGEEMNNFLYEALSDQLQRHMNMTRENFKSTIATRIEECPDTENYLKHNWNKSAFHVELPHRHQMQWDTNDSLERWKAIIHEKATFFQDHIAHYLCDRDENAIEFLEDCEEILKDECQNEPVPMGKGRLKRVAAKLKCAQDHIRNFITGGNDNSEKRCIEEWEEIVEEVTNKRNVEIFEEDYVLLDLYEQHHTDGEFGSEGCSKELGLDIKGDIVPVGEAVHGYTIFDYKRLTAAVSGSVRKLMTIMPAKVSDQVVEEFSALYKNVKSEDKVERIGRLGKSKRFDGFGFQSCQVPVMKNKNHCEAVDVLPREKSQIQRSKSLEDFPHGLPTMVKAVSRELAIH